MLEDLHALLDAILITDGRVSITNGAPIISRGATAYANQVLISSLSTYYDRPALLNRLIFDAVYGSWILSLPLFTLDASIRKLALVCDCYYMYNE